MWWFSGQSVCFAVGKTEVQIFFRAVVKISLRGIHSFPAWPSVQKRGSVEEKILRFLLASLRSQLRLQFTTKQCFCQR